MLRPVMKAPALIIACVALAVVVAGCGKRTEGKGITELQRKEAAHLDSEAQFAITMRQWERAEGLYAKMTQLCPDTGPYWVSLGAMRVRLGKRETAKDAYKSALKAFEAEADKDKTQVEPWLKQVEVLALLGRTEDGRATLDKAAKRFPNDRTLRAFIEGKSFDRMIADPMFKQSAL
jgi:tetratricopeptide (TPR) repeat protein